MTIKERATPSVAKRQPATNQGKPAVAVRAPAPAMNPRTPGTVYPPPPRAESRGRIYPPDDLDAAVPMPAARRRVGIVPPDDLSEAPSNRSRTTAKIAPPDEF